MSGPLLELRDVERHFKSPDGTVRAVDGVSLTVAANESVGLVGESGSGKTTLGRIALKLHDVNQGQVVFDGTDITNLKGKQLRLMRRRFQMVFQDPISTLNPRMQVGALVAEPLQELLGLDGGERRRRVARALEGVHLLPDIAHRYPRELSGGQAQRVGIARALALEPELIVADEPIAALDASVAAQIMELLVELQQQSGVAYLFISHDLATVRRLCDRVAVMYQGRIVEIGDTASVYSAPRHPYTAALLSASPSVDAALRAADVRIVLPSDSSGGADTAPGSCRFHNRCPIGPAQNSAHAACARDEPSLIGVDDHLAACHFSDDVAGLVEKRSGSGRP